MSEWKRDGLCYVCMWFSISSPSAIRVLVLFRLPYVYSVNFKHAVLLVCWQCQSKKRQSNRVSNRCTHTSHLAKTRKHQMPSNKQNITYLVDNLPVFVSFTLMSFDHQTWTHSYMYTYTHAHRAIDSDKPNDSTLRKSIQVWIRNDDGSKNKKTTIILIA